MVYLLSVAYTLISPSLLINNYILLLINLSRDKYPIVGDVRGKGLMLGMELVEDKETRQPITPHRIMEVWEGLRELGVLVGRGGHYRQVSALT